jgi:hypothetical protein
MKVAIYDRGVCGIEQTFYVGTVNKETDATTGTQFPVKLPAGFRIISFFVDVKTAFASATLDVSGDQSTPVKYVDAATLNAVGFTTKDSAYKAVGDKDVALTAKLSAAETGGGCADIFVKAIRLEL